jgi:DNA-directed RNA polymerase subunit RPC12/RpoP
MTVREYTCAACGETFPYVDEDEWSDDDARAEYEQTFGDMSLAAVAIVCDDCYNAIMPRITQ